MTRRLGPSKATRLPCAEGLQPVARQHDAGRHQLLVELAHRLEQLGRRHAARFAVLGRLHENHDTHGASPLVGEVPCGPHAHATSEASPDRQGASVFFPRPSGIARQESRRVHWPGLLEPQCKAVVARCVAAPSREETARPFFQTTRCEGPLTVRAWLCASHTNGTPQADHPVACPPAAAHRGSPRRCPKRAASAVGCGSHRTVPNPLPGQIVQRRMHAGLEHLPPPERLRQRLDHRVVHPRPWCPSASVQVKRAIVPPALVSSPKASSGTR